MIALFYDKVEKENYTSYNLNFIYETEEGQQDSGIQLVGSIFYHPYTQQEMEQRAIIAFNELFPGETLTQIIIN